MTTEISQQRASVDLPEFNYLHSLLVVSAACLFFLYEFVLQVSPGAMALELMRGFKIEAAQLGLLSAAYFLAYATMQIPAGLLFDRFGPRILLTCASVICGIGGLAFGLTENLFTASLGRFFIGSGSAFAFIGCLVLVSKWFPSKYFAWIAGIVQAMSSVGALIGTAPIAALVEKFGWRETVNVAAVIGFLIAVIIYLVVRDSPKPTAQHPHHFKKGELKRLGQVCVHSQSWIVALYSFTSWAPILIFATLWGTPYLMTAFGISATKASSAIAMVWIGIGVGSPLVGVWSDQISRRLLPLATCSFIGLIASLLLLYGNLSFSWIFPVLFVFGLSASAQILSFALVKDNNKPSIVGTAIGFNNVAVVAGGFLFQPVVGLILDWGWDGTMVNGVPSYAIADYQFALSVIPFIFLLGIILCVTCMRESHCEPMYHH